MTLTTEQKDAIDFYKSFGCPDLDGYHEFEVDSNSAADEPVTWIGGVDFTKREIEILKLGRLMQGLDK